MPRRKTEADERYNERRRYRRELERVKREAAKDARLNTPTVKAYIQRAQDLIERTYGKESPNLKEAFASLKNLLEPVRAQRKRARTNAQERRNIIFKQAMQRFPETEKKIFWRATQYLWQGEAPEERYDLVLDYFKNDEAFHAWIVSKYYNGKIEDITDVEREKLIKQYSSDLDSIYNFLLDKNKDALVALQSAGEVPDNYNNAIAKVVTYG